MKYWSLILLPISWIYAGVLSLRNLLFDLGVFPSHTPKIPSVVVGNLSMGGTGKTPMIQLLCSWLKDYEVTVISRGYGRKSKGLFVLNTHDSPDQVGDEPLEIKKAFPLVNVIVCEDRVKACQFVYQQLPKTQIILFDDAFQHRKIKAHFNLLLSLYHRPYFTDFVVPAGTLRELRKGAKRAHYTVFTKQQTESTIDFKKKHLKYSLSEFTFSNYQYQNLNLDPNYTYPLVTGIANTDYLTQHLSSIGINFKHFKYADHYNYQDKDLALWLAFLEQQGHQEIICTAKDAVKITSLNSSINVHVLKIEHNLANPNQLKDKIYGLIH